MKLIDNIPLLIDAASLPVRGAWIEIVMDGYVLTSDLSLPVRGAWIEIIAGTRTAKRNGSLPVRGAWIEILRRLLPQAAAQGRSPCGERGLK